MDFGLDFKIYIHPEWGCFVDLNNSIDVSPYFQCRDISNKRDSGLYFIYDGSGRIVYIGEGKCILAVWKDFLKKCRALNHKQNKNGTELVTKYIKSDWTIRIVAYGLTKLEGRILEAFFIREELKKGRKLTPIGATEWNGDDLINKNRGMSDKRFNEVAKVFLKKI